MTSRERVIKALNHEQPDRPPVFATITPQVAAKLSKALNLPDEEPLDSLLSTRISHTKLLTTLGNDCVGIAACAPASKPSVQDENGIITNEWGMKFKNAGLYNEFATFPLCDAETEADILTFPFFKADDPTRFTAARQAIAEYGHEYALVADLETTLFETSWYLTGLEKLLVDLLMEPAYLYPLLDKVMEINLYTGKELIAAGADIIWAGDDFGTQQSMIMDPELWRSVFKPRIKYLFEEFRKVNPHIKIAWHSCGSILPIIPDFIEIGLDILNPLQPLAHGMDSAYLKKEYGKDLSFFGAICVQDLLPNKSPLEIKTEVKRRVDILGKNGGFIVAPAHNIQDDTPVENILAFFEAVKEMSL